MSEEIDTGLVTDEDGVARCWWCGGDDQYQDYHDEEWGMPERRDERLFEKVCLEGFQSGLSWLTILRKRENFRRAFAEFDISAVAEFGEADVERLLGDAGIVRHRGKIEATINNAARALEMIAEEGSLAEFFWRYVPEASSRPKNFDKETLYALSQTAESQALSKELRRRGWKFVGPTTAYAFMQSVGIVNDHLSGCAARNRVQQARSRAGY